MKHTDHSIRQELAALLPRLRRFGRSLTGNPHDADDLVQIAVERALTKFDQLRPGSRLDSWVFTIMKNAWLDELRSRGRKSRLFAPEEAGESVGHWDTDDEMNLLSVLNAMDKLPEKHRLVVALVLVEGFSYDETAAMLEIPVGTVTSRLARARNMLTEQLAGTDESRETS